MVLTYLQPQIMRKVTTGWVNKVQLSGFQCYDCSELNQTKVADELKVASIAGANELVASHTNIDYGFNPLLLAPSNR